MEIVDDLDKIIFERLDISFQSKPILQSDWVDITDGLHRPIHAKCKRL
jgi:hypothetical protein